MTHRPTVPPDNRSPKGTGDAKTADSDQKPSDRDRNLEQQGQTANTKQNTTHQGYQQDR
jgi:hypothetical protein